MPEDKRKILYDAVSKDYDVGSYDEFSKKLDNPDSRKAFYDGVGEEFELGSYDDFEQKVGVKKKEPTGEGSSIPSGPSGKSGEEILADDLERSSNLHKKATKEQKLDPLGIVNGEYKEGSPSNVSPEDIGKSLVESNDKRVEEGRTAQSTGVLTPEMQERKDAEAAQRKAAKDHQADIDAANEKLTTGEKAKSLASSFAKGATNAPIATANLINTALATAKEKISGSPDYDARAQSLMDRKNLEHYANELFPEHATYKESVASKVSNALGQGAAMMATSGVGGAPSMAASGFAQTFDSEYAQAEEAGADKNTALNVALINGLLGAGLEALPVANMINRANRATGGSLLKAIGHVAKSGAKGGAEELVTESLQQVLSNKTAQETYDESRKVMDGVMESGEVGGITGFMLGALSSALGARIKKSESPEDVSLIQKAKDEVEQKQQENEGKQRPVPIPEQTQRQETKPEGTERGTIEPQPQEPGNIAPGEQADQGTGDLTHDLPENNITQNSDIGKINQSQKSVIEDNNVESDGGIQEQKVPEPENTSEKNIISENGSPTSETTETGVESGLGRFRDTNQEYVALQKSVSDLTRRKDQLSKSPKSPLIREKLGKIDGLIKEATEKSGLLLEAEKQRLQGEAGLLAINNRTSLASISGIDANSAAEARLNEQSEANPLGDVLSGETRKRSALNRAYEGDNPEPLREAIKRHGLQYEVEHHADVERSVEDFISEVGIGPALEAVRSKKVKGAAASMVYGKAIDDLNKRFSEAKDPEEVSALQKEEASILDELDRESRTSGRFISALGHIYNNSILNYSAKARAKEFSERTGTELPASSIKSLEEAEAKIKELQAEITRAEERARKAEEASVVSNIRDEVARKRGRPKSPSGKARAAKGLDDLASALGVTMMAEGTKRPDVVKALTEIGLGLIEEGIASVENVVEKIAEYVSDKFGGKLDVSEYAEDVQSRIERRLEKQAEIRIPHSIIREAVEAGNSTIADIVAYVKEQLSDKHPDLTDRQVRDAITGYGKTKTPSRDEVEADIRKQKRIGRVISALEDVRDKKRPLKSGQQRDKLDADERALQRELRDAIETLPADEETEAEQLKTALDTVKSRIKNQIEDLERELSEGRERRKADSNVSDTEVEQLKEQLEEVREVHRSVFGDRDLTEQERAALAEKSINKSIERTIKRIESNDIDQTRKAKPDSEGIRDAKRRSDYLKKVLRGLQEEAGIIEGRRLELAKKRVSDQTEELKRRLAEGDYSKKEKRAPLVEDTELTRLRAEKLKYQEQFDKALYDQELKNRTRAEKAKDLLWETWGLTRALSATADLSFIGVQGLILTSRALVRNPKHLKDALMRSYSLLASEKQAEQWLREIKSQEWYPLAKKSGLSLTEPDAKINAREEQFYSGWTNKLWNAIGYPLRAIGKDAHERWKAANPFKALERASTGYLDTLRAARFLDGKQMLEKKKDQGEEVSDRDYKDLADYINTFTGRASLGPLERNSELLTKVFFSPRNWASVVKTATPYALYHFGKMTPTARKMAMADFSTFLGLTTAMVAVAAAYTSEDDDEGTSVEFDPRSSDFGKIKLGNKRIDPWGGRIQMISLITKLATDSMKDKNGEILPLGLSHKTPTRGELLLRHMTNKLSPSASFVSKYLGTEKKRTRNNPDGTPNYILVDSFGKEYHMSEELKTKLYPIYFQTLSELYRDDPSALNGLLAFYAYFGGNVNVQANNLNKRGEK